MSASITTNNTFCNGQSGSIVEQPQEKSVAEETQSEEEGFVPVEKSIKIYPNPTTGRFTVELINITAGALILEHNIILLFFDILIDLRVGKQIPDGCFVENRNT